MSQVAPQVDVGVLTINGLAAFAPVLATLSADDVTPLAMVQMENLGSLFHINGKYALQVPDLLQRCKSTRLDRLGLLVGWRKGDSASLMAQSAGGQAISLLSMCIVNIYNESDTGLVLSELSRNILSQTIAISSPSQLVKVARTLSAKLQLLGFGNFLAAQVVRIHDAYKHFGKTVPDDFLDKILAEDMAELLHAMTRAVREESIVARITGSRSMGHILAIVMIMFPEDAFVTMENVIVFEGLRKSILVEFTDTDGIINVQVELKLAIQSAALIVPIEKGPTMQLAGRHVYYYEWAGCMADMLQVMFMEDGLICPEPLRVACCGMFEPLAKALSSIDNQSDTKGLRGNHGVMKLLGPYPHERINQVCQKLWKIAPGWAKPISSLKDAFDSLLLAFAEATPTVSCICQSETRCLPLLGWKDSRQEFERHICPLYRLWMAVGVAINCGFGCLFVNAGSGATIVPTNYLYYGSLPLIITAILDPKREPPTGPTRRGYSEIIHGCIKGFSGSLGSGVAGSTNSSTIYMAALQTRQLPTTMDALVILMEGQLIFNGRYQTSLFAYYSERPEVEKDIRQGTQPIIPSSIGEHSSLEMTIREGVDSLLLTTTIVVGGGIEHIDLLRTIFASWELHEAEPCEHPAGTPLEPQHEDAVLTTSLAAPAAIEGKIAIVQVSRNPVAQLFACVPENDYRRVTLLYFTRALLDDLTMQVSI
ncbi:hypothetical protein V496_01017 [Pseudogymnoascus sp. VKM F-4515 (FW-2607)]|nr:hypothetical protein V496_01017 [Pseudogymnoascus sp. VKM F-4515 (FW-2607)]